MNLSFLSSLAKKFTALRSGMTENSKYACILLLSVMVLTATFTGIAGPLQNLQQRRTEEIRYMQKEIELYRLFLQDPDRQEKLLQQQIVLHKLRGQLPADPQAELIVKKLYRKAEYNGVTITRLKQLPVRKNEQPLQQLAWETECTGAWEDLLGFVKDIENQEPYTRLSDIQVSRVRNSREISVKAAVVVYFCQRKDIIS